MPERYLIVKNFREFQHYSDRNPPWIKLYYALLDDLAFLALSEVTQMHLVKIWLTVSRHEGFRVPYDEPYIRAAIRAKSRVDLQAMVESGFLIVVTATGAASTDAIADASTSASTGDSNAASTDASADASADARNEPFRTPARARLRATEVTEGSENYSPPPPARARRTPGRGTAAIDAAVGGAMESALATRLASDSDRVSLTALLKIVPSAVTWIGEMLASLDGMPGHVHVTSEQLGQALRDYAGNGGLAKPGLKHFRSYLQRAAVKPAPAAIGGNGASGGASSPDPQVAALDRMREELRAKGELYV